jgi:hypothetical protein
MKCFYFILIAFNFIITSAVASCFCLDDLIDLNPFKYCSILADCWQPDERVGPPKMFHDPLMQPVQMSRKLKEIELAIQRQQSEEHKKNTILG